MCPTCCQTIIKQIKATKFTTGCQEVAHWWLLNMPEVVRFLLFLFIRVAFELLIPGLAMTVKLSYLFKHIFIVYLYSCMGFAQLFIFRSCHMNKSWLGGPCLHRKLDM